MKIADVQDGQNCPSNWSSMTIPNTSIKVCRSGQDAGGAYSAVYSTSAACLGFQQFCGKVIGYQKGTTDGFNDQWTGGNQIDTPYLDGLSITYGYPRKHLFSLPMGLTTLTNQYVASNCPCSKFPGQSPPSFVKEDYYCDSGNSGTAAIGTYYSSNPVWDGEGCTSEYSCCAQAGMPYFYRRLPVPVNDDIEVRLCNDEDFDTEAVLIGTMELYIL